MTAFQKKKKYKTINDYINYIKALTYVEIFEYNDNCSYAALDLDKGDVEIIVNYFTKLGFRCSYRSAFDEDFYRFYLEWQ